MPTCKLCHEETELRRSHIYPDHLYRMVRDEDRRFYAYSPEGYREVRQQGLWEHLFCHDCEQLLSREYENGFANFWVNNSALPDELKEEITIEGIDYLKFKLYHLSILFRTSVSQLPSFQHIDLGPHEEVIRQMLLNQTDNANYHLIAAALVREDNSVVKGLIMFPRRGSFEGHTFYQTLYAGCAWLIKVSSHNLPGIVGTGLQEDGTMFLSNERWEGYQAVQEMANLLRNNDQ